MRGRRRPSLCTVASLAALLCAGCHPASSAPAMLGPSGLRRSTSPPDLEAAFAQRDELLLAAIDRSLAWFDDPRSRHRYPRDHPALDHTRSRESVAVMRDLLRRSTSAEAFSEAVRRRFDIYEATGTDGDGAVLFTAYFAPEYEASRVRTQRFRYPLYGPPPSEVAQSRPTRRQIEDHDLLAGHELVWLDDPLDVYLTHVNGSARLRLPDGDFVHVGHAGTNSYTYTSLGRLLIAEGLATADEMSLAKIREIYGRKPQTVIGLMRLNDRYVFFRTYDPQEWPQSALGIPLTPGRVVATDKSVFPPGGVVLVETTMARETGRRQPFVRFMLDQDTGGAIKGPGRADVFIGIGAHAGEIAGRQNHTGRLYYFVLKPDGG